MQRQFSLDLEGVEAERGAFAAMQHFAKTPTSDNHAAMIRALAGLSDDRCRYVLGHYNEAAFDVTLEIVAAYREAQK